MGSRQDKKWVLEGEGKEERAHKKKKGKRVRIIVWLTVLLALLDNFERK
jgi:hypothetical protein